MFTYILSYVCMYIIYYLFGVRASPTSFIHSTKIWIFRETSTHFLKEKREISKHLFLGNELTHNFIKIFNSLIRAVLNYYIKDTHNWKIFFKLFSNSSLKFSTMQFIPSHLFQLYIHLKIFFDYQMVLVVQQNKLFL